MSVHKLESQIDARKEQPAIFMFPIAFLSLALLFAGTFEFIPSWIMRDLVDLPHLWHIAELGALAAILLAGTTLGLITRPKQKVLLAQFFVISTVILAVGIVPFDFRGAVLLAIGALFVALYPARRELLRFAPNGSISKPLLVLTLAIAVCLDPIIQREITWQINGANDPHAQFLHWIGSALLMILLIVAGALSSTKRPGWQWLAVVTGLTYVFLGIIALLVPDYPGSWGQLGGLASLFAGAMYIMFTLVVAEGMRLREESRRIALSFK